MHTLDLPANGAFDAGIAGALLRNHALPGAEEWDPVARRHRRVLHVAGAPHAVTVELGATGVRLETTAADASTRAALAGRVRGWFDLDTDTDRIASDLGDDPVLGPLLAARPGLRATRYPEGFEAAVAAVLGQQVSVAAGRTFGGRLVAALGEDGPEGLRLFPTPARVLATPLDELRAGIGVTNARARTLAVVAAAFADGLELDPAGDRAETRRRLLALAGIGPWTADYLAVRALGDPDAFPAGDLVLRRALGGVSAAEAERASGPWRPWRAYALFHLWTATGAVG